MPPTNATPTPTPTPPRAHYTWEIYANRLLTLSSVYRCVWVCGVGAKSGWCFDCVWCGAQGSCLLVHAVGGGWRGARCACSYRGALRREHGGGLSPSPLTR